MSDHQQKSLCMLTQDDTAPETSHSCSFSVFLAVCYRERNYIVHVCQVVFFCMSLFTAVSMVNKFKWQMI